ncbi:MgtC/SapB family protein [Mycobacterium palustre]|uniref:Mg2+ transporter-C (MgtC) family protein n=1 Tax=Mycobacterium palustre TaxID=153971 RepID=A0A1X1ZWV2_9MYCO|nr:MgtC/SapB family protein [Mycobacterium palustre]MCV7101123.1 MgtC/SapB family protein [Mycobacterium palustre]ORW28682.1 Mg2+ transporter-C (MgtC) family protein [Mycobacterium palustre]
MQFWLADPLFGGAVQNGRHLIELVAAFGLTALVGLERTVQGKVAGLRTQTIVGTSAALIMLVSKYGFGDVLNSGTIALDPSRVAAQIVSGVGFLGAGIIITRRGTVRLHIIYENGRGVLRELLRVCGQHDWQLTGLDADAHDIDDGEVRVAMTLTGAKMGGASEVFGEVDGVVAVLPADDDPD